jgi:hypothetical protein
MPDREINFKVDPLVHNEDKISPEEAAQIEQYERDREEIMFYQHEIQEKWNLKNMQ